MHLIRGIDQVRKIPVISTVGLQLLSNIHRILTPRQVSMLTNVLLPGRYIRVSYMSVRGRGKEAPRPHQAIVIPSVTVCTLPDGDRVSACARAYNRSMCGYWSEEVEEEDGKKESEEEEEIGGKGMTTMMVMMKTEGGWTKKTHLYN